MTWRSAKPRSAFVARLRGTCSDWILGGETIWTIRTCNEMVGNRLESYPVRIRGVKNGIGWWKWEHVFFFILLYSYRVKGAERTLKWQPLKKVENFRKLFVCDTGGDDDRLLGTWGKTFFKEVGRRLRW